MRKFLTAGLCSVAALTFGAGAISVAHAETPAKEAPEFAAVKHANEHWDMLSSYCVDCHNFEDWAGGIAFDVMTSENVPQDAETWETVIRKLRGRLMPPPGKDQPAQAEIDEFVSWMEGYLDEAVAADPDPGHIPLHRLNRKEYANAVEDLLGLEIEPEVYLPRDDVSDGFDNIARVLQVTPSFMDQYVSAARAIAVEAVGEPNPLPSGTQYNVHGPQNVHVEGLPLGTRGGRMVEHLFPADGEYEVNIADLAAALWVYNMEFENDVIVTLDGRKIYETTIGGEADMKAIDQKQDPAVDAINERLKNIRFETTAGLHRVGVTFRQRTFAESDDRLRPQTLGANQDRILRINQFEIRGPFNPTGITSTPSREKIFVCYPEAASEERACAEQIIANLAEKAYRRPLTEAETAPLINFYEIGAKQDGFEEGVRMALTGILASPSFLYRPETAPEGLQAGDTYLLNDLELASRLSFFLWSSVPDEPLLKAAVAGKLNDKEELDRQVRRMLASPKSKTLVTDFAYQWLHLAHLEEVNPDAGIFPYASGANDPREDYVTELMMFIDSVLREDRNVAELMTADWTYLNERLALLYGIKDVKGDRFRRVSLDDHPERHGLLGKGGVLMVSSYPNRTAPVLRGEYILDRISGTPPTPAPPDVGDLMENEDGAKKVLTVREMMQRHSQDPSCHSCHGVLDPLGFALENFNAVGVWREKDRFSGSMVDTAGVLPNGTPVDGPVTLRKALMERPEQFVQTLTENLMIYALGRSLTYKDMPRVREIVDQVKDEGNRFSAIVTAIVNSDQFRMRTVPGDDAPVQEAALHE